MIFSSSLAWEALCCSSFWIHLRIDSELREFKSGETKALLDEKWRQVPFRGAWRTGLSITPFLTQP